MKYSTEMKENAISRYQSGKETTTSIISELGIPRSTFYGWIKEYNSTEETQDSALQFTPKNFRKVNGHETKFYVWLYLQNACFQHLRGY